MFSKLILMYFPGLSRTKTREYITFTFLTREVREGGYCSSAPAQLVSTESPAFPGPASRGRCEVTASLFFRALERSVKGEEVRRAEGRSILDCPDLYHPLSSSLPGALGLRAWLLGGSGELRRPRRQQPGCLKSF